ncbi:MAG: pyridoxal-phosphate dependent enzyme [Acidobacteria bacterium]|nr:pyridoxal-phosphate dependent enzyme [Acidobacteriota bacterium]
MPSLPVTLREVRAAREAIAGLLHRTPVVTSRTLSALSGFQVHLKLENLQKTGSFKPRGAITTMKGLTDQERSRGVITISAGNHAQGVAYAASVLGCRATVVMPASASPAKAEAARGYGAEVILHGDIAETFARMNQLRDERNLVFIHPFDAPGTIAGQATCGVEILEDVPDTDVVVAGIGGGGLSSGLAVALHEMRPKTRLVGVEPVGAASMRRSFDEGKAVRLDRTDTIADGLAAPFAGTLNYEILKATGAEVVLVTDDEIRTAMRFLLERCKTLAEPAGAAATAAILAGKIKAPAGSQVVSVVSGGNIGPELLAKHLADGRGASA